MSNDSSESMKEEYSRYTYRKLIFIVLCVIAIVILFFVSLCVGTLQLTPEEVFSLFFDHIRGNLPEDPISKYDDHIIWDFRVPRAIFAILAGISLSIGGAVMQSVMKNPLADPYTTGVSSGALFGVAVAIILGLSVGGTGSFGVIFNAILFSMVPIGLIVVMAPFFRKSPATLILA